MKKIAINVAGAVRSSQACVNTRPQVPLHSTQRSGRPSASLMRYRACTSLPTLFGVTPLVMPQPKHNVHPL